VFSGYSAAW